MFVPVSNQEVSNLRVRHPDGTARSGSWGASVHKARFPLHCVMRVRADVPRLRCAVLSSAIRVAMTHVKGFDGFAGAHVSIQHNHIHWIVEARDSIARSR